MARCTRAQVAVEQNLPIFHLFTSSLQVETGLWWPPHRHSAAFAFWATMVVAVLQIPIWGLRNCITMWPIHMMLTISVLHSFVCQWSHQSLATTWRDIENIRKLKYNFKQI